MSISKTITASGQIAVAASVVFGLTVTTNINPASPPTGSLLVSLHDEATNAGAGALQARIVMSQQDTVSTQHISFPAGIRLQKGISIIVVVAGHSDFTVSVDYS